MIRGLYLLFGVFAYAFFFGTFLYLIAFVGNLPGIPRTVDQGGMMVALAEAAITNLALILLFGVQHSVMARQGFKRAWTRLVPEPIERSMYVLLASAVLWVMFHFWRPMPGTIWSIEHPLAAGLIWVLFAAGWLIVLLSTFLISHFELFGLKQVWMHLRTQTSVAPQFRQPFFYKLVRHPLYSGFILAFWATPVMTLGHLLFAVGMTAYMLVAIRYEERDLVALFGEDYETYRGRVGMLAPRMRRGA
jgi:protein-S-isoprenylcysteine O-methyltransferase Ste14